MIDRTENTLCELKIDGKVYASEAFAKLNNQQASTVYRCNTTGPIPPSLRQNWKQLAAYRRHSRVRLLGQYLPR